jgi:hypothetical protein
MKKFTAVFGVGLVGLAFSLVMTIYTGVKEYREKNAPVTHFIPNPATAESPTH